MTEITNDEIERAPIRWIEAGESNGEPVLEFRGYGHHARVAFGFDKTWGAVIDNSGKLFDQFGRSDALEYAEKRIREKLILRRDSAEKFRSDIAPILKPA